MFSSEFRVFSSCNFLIVVSLINMFPDMSEKKKKKKFFDSNKFKHGIYHTCIERATFCI